MLVICFTGARQLDRAGNPLDVEALLNLGEESLRLSPEQLREAFGLCYKYRTEYVSKGLWDNGDLVLAIHSALQDERERHPLPRWRPRTKRRRGRRLPIR